MCKISWLKLWLMKRNALSTIKSYIGTHFLNNCDMRGNAETVIFVKREISLQGHYQCKRYAWINKMGLDDVKMWKLHIWDLAGNIIKHFPGNSVTLLLNTRCWKNITDFDFKYVICSPNSWFFFVLESQAMAVHLEIMVDKVFVIFVNIFLFWICFGSLIIVQAHKSSF